ncbi:MAG: glycosyltransferase family 2 protein [Proteobacteria bacterium]|nr:glycosyltransferase family 2 protein [Pseudomonadota bacterium]
MSTLIVIPAFNEAENLKKLLKTMQQECTEDIIIINDFSHDDTENVVKSFNIKCLSLPIQLGAWGATQTGIRYADENNYQQVITMDADGQHLPHEIKHLLESKLNSTANVIIGTHIARLSKLKKAAWHYFKLLTRLNIEDLTSGFRLYDQNAIKLLASRQASLLDYQDVGVLLLLTRSSLRIEEISVKMVNRSDGRSRIFSSWWTVIKYMAQTTTLCIANIGSKK